MAAAAAAAAALGDGGGGGAATLSAAVSEGDHRRRRLCYFAAQIPTAVPIDHLSIPAVESHATLQALLFGGNV
jgi:hypothetical protein